MRKKREPETDEQRDERLKHQAQERVEQADADDKALDAAIQKSIELYGA
jgi:hypothetical protein